MLPGTLPYGVAGLCCELSLVSVEWDSPDDLFPPPLMEPEMRLVKYAVPPTNVVEELAAMEGGAMACDLGDCSSHAEFGIGGRGAAITFGS